LYLLNYRIRSSHSAPPWRAPELHQDGSDIGELFLGGNGVDVFCGNVICNFSSIEIFIRESQTSAAMDIVDSDYGLNDFYDYDVIATQSANSGVTGYYVEICRRNKIE
jgi:hypothetical protein